MGTAGGQQPAGQVANGRASRAGGAIKGFLATCDPRPDPEGPATSRGPAVANLLGRRVF